MRAGSRMSGLLVPARTTTLVVVLNPGKTEGKDRCGNVFSEDSSVPRFLSPTVHLHQKLIQRVLLLTLSSEVSSPPFSPHGIDLVDEEDARRIVPGHREEISDLHGKQSLFYLRGVQESNTAYLHFSFSTLAGPTPTNISRNSEPLTVMKGTLASPAVALARRVFPVPGGPVRMAPYTQQT